MFPTSKFAMPPPRRTVSSRPPPPGTAGNEWTKVAVAAAALLVLIGIVGFGYYKSREATVATDPETLCRTDSPITDVLAMLIDVSDTLSDVQRVDILNRLERTRAGLPQFGLLEVYVLSSGDTTLLRPSLSICNPGDGQGMSSLYQNPEIARRHWTKDFKARVDGVIGEAILHPDSATSPIFEAIRSVALFSFGALDREQAHHKLVIVSDLIQNVPGKYSQYQSSSNFAEFSKTAYYTSVRSDLSDVTVEALYLNRPTAKAVQGRQHIDFWDAFFAAQGASLEKVNQIFGAP